MLRPWNVGEFGTCEEDHYSLGCTAWRRRLPTPRVDEAPGSASNAPRAPALTLAQKRKLSNLFAEVTQRQTGAVASKRVMREQDVLHVCAALHLAAAGVAPDEGHPLAQAARAWFAFFAASASHDEITVEGLSLPQFLDAAAAMLAEEHSELPEPVAALPAAQFALAAGDSGLLSRPQFVAWRMATGRLSAAALSKATQIDGPGGHEPTLDDVFAAADAGRKKALNAEDWARLTVRFWVCSEPWDELNAYSL